MTVGLPKGSVVDKSLGLIQRATGKPTPKGKLSFTHDNVSYLLLKHRDVPKLVSSGLLSWGITSGEWVRESNQPLVEVCELDWCDIRISLISKESKLPHTCERSITCVTEFSRIANEYFSRQKYGVQITKVSGSTESLVATVFDCGVECIETGETLAANGLKELEILYTCRTVVVANERFVLPCREFVEQYIPERIDLCHDYC
jgi:ATP phosphoribosyltransferase